MNIIRDTNNNIFNLYDPHGKLRKVVTMPEFHWDKIITIIITLMAEDWLCVKHVINLFC